VRKITRWVYDGEEKEEAGSLKIRNKANPHFDGVLAKHNLRESPLRKKA